MFKLNSVCSDEARCKVMEACMVNIRASDATVALKSAEVADMQVRLSRCKHENGVLFVVYAMRMKGFEDIEGWVQDTMLDVIGDAGIQDHVAVFIQYHYHKMIQYVDAFLDERVLLLESGNAVGLKEEGFRADVEPQMLVAGCIATAHGTFKDAIAGAMGDFALSALCFAGRHIVPLPLPLELKQCVDDKTPVPRVSLLVGLSKTVFKAKWSKLIAESDASIFLQDAELRYKESGLNGLKTDASMWMYRRGVLVVIDKYLDFQFLKLAAFVEKLRVDHGVFADGTGAHIQEFVQRELSIATSRLDQYVQREMTISKWAGDMMHKHDQDMHVKAPESHMAWLEISYTICGERPFHDILFGDVGHSTANFMSKVRSASLNFGLPNDQFRDKYMPVAVGSKRRVSSRK